MKKTKDWSFLLWSFRRLTALCNVFKTIVQYLHLHVVHWITGLSWLGKVYGSYVSYYVLNKVNVTNTHWIQVSKIFLSNQKHPMLNSLPKYLCDIHIKQHCSLKALHDISVQWKPHKISTFFDDATWHSGHPEAIGRDALNARNCTRHVPPRARVLKRRTNACRITDVSIIVVRQRFTLVRHQLIMFSVNGQL